MIRTEFSTIRRRRWTMCKCHANRGINRMGMGTSSILSMWRIRFRIISHIH